MVDVQYMVLKMLSYVGWPKKVGKRSVLKRRFAGFPSLELEGNQITLFSSHFHTKTKFHPTNAVSMTGTLTCGNKEVRLLDIIYDCMIKSQWLYLSKAFGRNIPFDIQN